MVPLQSGKIAWTEAHRNHRAGARPQLRRSQVGAATVRAFVPGGSLPFPHQPDARARASDRPLEKSLDELRLLMEEIPHAFPEGDLGPEHRVTPDCWCEPEVIALGEGVAYWLHRRLH